jgi:hypothetical protein
LWLLIEHQHFRVKPSGVSRLFIWLATAGLVVIAATAGVGNLLGRATAQDSTSCLPSGGGGRARASAAGGPARPGVTSHRHRPRGGIRRALQDHRHHGGDTLDYFALRDDKSWFFTGESLVAYSVINGVMLVSPDPIGPPEDRAEVWSDVMDMAQANGWQPSVLAASQSWLPVYRASGLVDHYIGDEAIVDCHGFNLKGKSMKSLRGAYNRMKKSGCRVECFESTDDLSVRAEGPADRADDRDPSG